jgi:hypothetical protein
MKVVKGPLFLISSYLDRNEEELLSAQREKLLSPPKELHAAEEVCLARERSSPSLRRQSATLSSRRDEPAAEGDARPLDHPMAQP